MFFTPVMFFTSTQGNAAFVVTTQPGISATLTTSSPNRKTFSVSLWAKPNATESTNEALAFSGAGWTSYSLAYIDPTTSTKRTRFTSVEASTTLASPMSGNTVYSSAAWTHYLYAVDTTQATAADRIKFYVNGSLVSHVSGTEPTQNADMHWLVNGEPLYIGATPSSADLFTGRIAYVDIVDGIQLAPGDVTVDITGTLHAKDCTRHHGTNGLSLWGGTKLVDAWRGVTFAATGLTYDVIDKPPYKKQPISLGSSMASSVGSTVYTTLSGFYTTFTTTGTWTVPSGVTSVAAEAYGQGGTGGEGSSENGGNGGGSGGYSKTNAVSVTPGATTYISRGTSCYFCTSNRAPTNTSEGAIAYGASGQSGASAGIGDTATAGVTGAFASGTNGGAGGNAPGPVGGTGGAGGNDDNRTGRPGNVPGGGGGGGYRFNYVGGAGGQGRVFLAYSQRL